MSTSTTPTFQPNVRGVNPNMVFHFEPSAELVQTIYDLFYDEGYIANFTSNGLIRIISTDDGKTPLLEFPKEFTKEQIVWLSKYVDYKYAQGHTAGIREGKRQKQEEIKNALGFQDNDD